MHPIEDLFRHLAPDVEPYPEGVVRPDGHIPGTAFFPGGSGLWMPNGLTRPPMPTGGVMVLGHDFHSETGFKASLAQGTEFPERPANGYRVPATWIALRRLLDEARVPLERCFFTNAYMGLREGHGNTGPFPGARDPAFVARCRRFFLRQLDAQQPAVILSLGIWVPRFLAPLSSQLDQWSRAKRMKDLDDAGPIVHNVSFSGSRLSCTVAALTHPSLRGPNVRRRRYDGATGHEAEIALLIEAMRAVKQGTAVGSP